MGEARATGGRRIPLARTAAGALAEGGREPLGARRMHAIISRGADAKSVCVAASHMPDAGCERIH